MKLKKGATAQRRKGTKAQRRNGATDEAVNCKKGW